MSLAVCLAGGGVKGAAHIGVLKAIDANGTIVEVWERLLEVIK